MDNIIELQLGEPVYDTHYNSTSCHSSHFTYTISDRPRDKINIIRRREIQQGG